MTFFRQTPKRATEFFRGSSLSPLRGCRFYSDHTPGLCPGLLPSARFAGSLRVIFITATQLSVRIKWAHRCAALIVAHEDFDTTFGLAETFLTIAGKLHALLKQLEAFLKRQLSLL